MRMHHHSRTSLMGYVPMGDVAASDFNATKYPGVSKPSTFAALAIFKDLQAQLNRVAAVSGNTPIAIDGDIGAGTVGLYAKVKPLVATMAGSADGSLPKITAASDNVSIATYADVIAKVAKVYADSKGAPAKVAGPAPVKVPTIVTASGAETPVSADMEFFAKIFGRPLSSTEKIGLLAVGGGIGYMLLTKKKRKGKGRR